MKRRILLQCAVCLALAVVTAHAQIGTRFPSEKKVVPDPVTGVPLTFLTTASGGDSKIYPTHHQWTADGKWLVFRSDRVRGQAMAVNEESGAIVQLTESGYNGMLCLATESMHLYFMRNQPMPEDETQAEPAPGERRRRGPRGPAQIVRTDLAKLFADSEAGTLKEESAYETVMGTPPPEMGAGGDMAIDADEQFAYFRLGGDYAAAHYDPGQAIESSFGPRGMGAGPAGIGWMNLETGETGIVATVGFQIGHIQTNPWAPGEIVFCWETGGKSPQRTWTVMRDGSGLRPLYPEAPYEWVTHEAVITPDEVAIALIGHRRPGVGVDRPDDWGPAGSPDHPTGLGIVNLRSREMRIIGQVPFGDPGRSFWHVHGSPDGRWAVADDFQYRLWIIDRTSGETALLADLGGVRGARDHIHPTFNADSTKIEVQTAMLAEDGRSLNICIVPVPQSWLDRHYDKRLVD